MFTATQYTAMAVCFLIGYILGLVCGWFERGQHNAESDE